jgi:hypothetical protein
MIYDDHKQDEETLDGATIMSVIVFLEACIIYWFGNEFDEKYIIDCFYSYKIMKKIKRINCFY